MATTVFAYVVKIHPINEIAKEHDGGGHPLASGANSYSLERKRNHLQKLKKLDLKTDKITCQTFQNLID